MRRDLVKRPHPASASALRVLKGHEKGKRAPPLPEARHLLRGGEARRAAAPAAEVSATLAPGVQHHAPQRVGPEDAELHHASAHGEHGARRVCAAGRLRVWCCQNGVVLTGPTLSVGSEEPVHADDADRLPRLPPLPPYQ